MIFFMFLFHVLIIIINGRPTSMWYLVWPTHLDRRWKNTLISNPPAAIVRQPLVGKRIGEDNSEFNSPCCHCGATIGREKARRRQL